MLPGTLPLTARQFGRLGVKVAVEELCHEAHLTRVDSLNGATMPALVLLRPLHMHVSVRAKPGIKSSI